MILLVDAGNSRIKWALASDGKLHGHGAFPWRGASVGTLLNQHWRKLENIQRVFIANVGGASLRTALGDWVQTHRGINIDCAQTQAQACGVTNGYREFQRLGVDRWLSLLAAWSRHARACCIVDCGTAVTLDAINAKGEHLGGLIVPGLGLMHDALARNTDALALAPANSPDLLARDTRTAMSGGSLQAIVGFIELTVSRLREQLGEGPTCLLTGGDAGQILPRLSQTWEHRPYLVLEGLQQLAGLPR